MKNCPRCKSNEINESDNYCKICGLDLKEASAATAASIKEKCSICKERTGVLHCDDDSRICETCAQVMNDLAPL